MYEDLEEALFLKNASNNKEDNTHSLKHYLERVYFLDHHFFRLIKTFW